MSLDISFLGVKLITYLLVAISSTANNHSSDPIFYATIAITEYFCV